MEQTLLYPTLCVTHKCNLNCVYCYQKHKSNAFMSFETAKECIDTLYNNFENKQVFELSFIGGEPLLNFEVIKKVYEYVQEKGYPPPDHFFITTNGTLLTDEMKEWFTKHKDNFILGLSLDGTPEVHNKNRSNSFDSIDIPFFLKNYPNQAVKMTLSEESLSHLAESTIYIHSLGFKIDGMNLAEGDFKWENKKDILKREFSKLVDHYSENPNIQLDGLFKKALFVCEGKKDIERGWCGTGTTTPFFDVDGKTYPCSFMTPMTFSKKELKKINEADFSLKETHIDNYCLKNCYLYPVCPTCAGANFLATGSFNTRDKGNKCELLKLTALFSAIIQAKRIIKGKVEKNAETYHTINAIKKIYEMYGYLLG